MGLVLVTAPAARAVTLEELKLHLRVDHDDEDSLLWNILETATQDIETLSLHKLIAQTWDWYLDSFPATSYLKLPFLPLISVTGVYYTVENGVEETWASSNYLVDARNKPGKIVLKSNISWPSYTLEPVNGVRVRFICGHGTAAKSTGADVDARLRQALLMLCGHYYENRETSFVGQGYTAIQLPFAVHSLCNDLRAQVWRAT